MKKWLLPFLLISSAVVFAQTSTSAPELAPPNLQHEPPMLGIHWARGFDPMARASQAQGATVKTVNMTYRGGKIMPTAVIKQIFWGPSWGNSTFVGDKITGLTAWNTGFSGSNYAKTSDEYTGTNGQVGATTLNQGHVIDLTNAANGSSSSAILAEVCKQVTNGNITRTRAATATIPFMWI